MCTHIHLQVTHLWGSGCIKDQIRQLPEQFVKRAFHVAAGQNGPTQVSQQPGGELPLAGFGLQGQRHSQRRHLAPQGPQVQFCKQLLDVHRDVDCHKLYVCVHVFRLMLFLELKFPGRSFPAHLPLLHWCLHVQSTLALWG